MSTYEYNEAIMTMAKMKTIDYITVHDFAKKADVSRQAVHQAIEAGRIKDFKKIGPIVVIHPSELKKFKGVKHD